MVLEDVEEVEAITALADQDAASALEGAGEELQIVPETGASVEVGQASGRGGGGDEGN